MRSSTGCGTTSSSSPDQSIPRGRVGRDGTLRLAFRLQGPRTVLVEHRYTLPLQALGSMALDDSGAATVMLLNPTGGLLGGDVLQTSVAMGSGSRVCLTTPLRHASTGVWARQPCTSSRRASRAMRRSNT